MVIIQQDSYWQSYQTLYSDVLRTAVVELTEGMVYRVRVRSQSKNCGLSSWSDLNYTSTLKNVSSYIEVQGTGQHNPVDSYVTMNDTVLYKNTFTGLLLMIIHRFDLSIVFSQTYNTLLYSSDAEDMSNEIKSYDSNHLVIIISSTGWELNFTKELSNTINEIGGYLTLSYVQLDQSLPIYKVATDSDYGRPYAFIGIPGQRHITGQNFEILKSLNKYYNYNDALYNALPTARIRVRLVFNNFRQFYMLQNNYRIFRVTN